MQRLHFISFEKYPLKAEDLRLAHQRWPELAPWAQQLQAQWPSAFGGCHRLLLDGGREVSADAVALHYGVRSAGGVIDGWLVDTADDAALARVASAGITARAVPLWLSDDATRAQVARDAVELALTL